MHAVTATCPARIALAGNPSDGFGGAVFAVPVHDLRAAVTVEPAEQIEIAPETQRNELFGSVSELREHVRRHGVSGLRELLVATIDMVATAPVDLGTFRISAETSIPRSVGLAGSSALVIASIRALLAAHEAPAMATDELAGLALAVETDGMGIRAGLQDRVVQAYGLPMLMRFAAESRRVVAGRTAGTYLPITSAPRIDVLLAWRHSAAEPSTIAHAQRLADPPASDFAEAAEAAAAAWQIGDPEQLGRAMDRTFELRRSMMPLRDDHVELVEIARDAGGHANYTGSGGAIGIVASDGADLADIDVALRAAGCATTPVRIGIGIDTDTDIDTDIDTDT